MIPKKELTVDLFLHSAIVFSTAIAVALFFFTEPDALGSTDTGCFRYFTTDSNLLMALASLFCIVYERRMLFDPEKKMPFGLLLFRFAATVSVTVTFLTVVFFLAPAKSLNSGIGGYLFFFTGNTFVLHFSTPVLAAVSFLFFSGKDRILFRQSLWNLTPTVVYSVVHLILVVFLKIWYDWYGFTFGGNLWLVPFSILGMYIITVGISEVLRRLREKRINR